MVRFLSIGKNLLRGLYIYLFVGFFYSLATHWWGLTHDKPLSFGFLWAESLGQFCFLFFWLFIMPALLWPLEVYWSLYHFFK